MLRLEKLIITVLLLLLVLGLAQAEESDHKAYMEMQCRSYEDLKVPSDQDSVEYTFWVTFKPYWINKSDPLKKKFSTYRFGLSDFDESAGGTATIRHNNTSVTELGKYVTSTVTFDQEQSRNTGNPFNLSRFSHNYQLNKGFDPSNKNAHFLDGSFTFKLDAQALREKLNNDPNFKLSFWVVGQATGRSDDKSAGCLVEIPVRRESSIKISNLTDISLSDNKPSATMTFCVYVSDPPYEYRLVGLKGLRSPDYKMENGAGGIVNYEVAFANTETELNSATYHSTDSVFDYMGPLLGSGSLSCNGGHNAAVGIKVPPNQSISDGAYTDTITVTVEPY